jgi:hypothetical protein
MLILITDQKALLTYDLMVWSMHFVPFDIFPLVSTLPASIISYLILVPYLKYMNAQETNKIFVGFPLQRESCSFQFSTVS